MRSSTTPILPTTTGNETGSSSIHHISDSTPPPSEILKRWLVPYLIGTVLAGAVGAPLVWFGVDLPIDQRNAWQAVLIGTVISYAVMILLDFFATAIYLLRNLDKETHTIVYRKLRRFPFFCAVRSLTIHWLGFAVPLVVCWIWLFEELKISIVPIQVIFFLVVSLLMSFMHGIVEYYLVSRRLHPFLRVTQPATHSLLPIWLKIGGITLFVSVIPIALLAETIYLKLAHANTTTIVSGSGISPIIMWTVVYTLVSIVVSLVITWLVASDISTASKQLVEGFQRLAQGDKQHRLTIASADEFEELAAGFNSMATELQRNEMIYEEFGKLVDPTIRDEMLSGRVNREGELRYAVILFTDLMNFTPLAESLKPAELISYLNELFDHLVKTISAHGGTVNKFVGDAILAFWNLPISMENPEIAAVKCALQMQEVVEQFNRNRSTWRKNLSVSIAPAQIGIGIHAGNVIAGTVGAEHRREYTVLGNHVNLAARFQQHTRNSSCNIIVSNTIAEKIRPFTRSSAFSLIPMGTVELKGVAEPQAAFGVLRPTPSNPLHH